MEKKPRRKKQQYSVADLINDIKRVANESLDKKLTVSLYISKGNYPMSVILITFGSWKNAGNQAGLKQFPIYTENDYLEDIKQVANQFPDLQLTFSLYSKHGKFNRSQINTKFGNWCNALEKAEIRNDNKIKIRKAIVSEEDLLNDLKQANKLKKSNEFLMTYYRKNGKHDISTYLRRFGSWKNAVEKAGFIYKKNKENDYLEDIKLVASQFPDVQLSFLLYSKHGKFNRKQINNKFGNFRKALQKAGINNDNKTNIPNFRISEEDLLNDLKKAGKLKKDNESVIAYYRRNGKHSRSTYRMRFGSWQNALEKAGLLPKNDTEVHSS